MTSMGDWSLDFLLLTRSPPDTAELRLRNMAIGLGAKNVFLILSLILVVDQHRADSRIEPGGLFYPTRPAATAFEGLALHLTDDLCGAQPVAWDSVQPPAGATDPGCLADLITGTPLARALYLVTTGKKGSS
eukprot:CAMPEP_0116562962 /NCGR_PEP_ID=MMETSP0397-20121206/12461_1 /TAXON_ID=216820 /ORGANISM="Cyclophora tenuis, Strain ECT3854" /LENGTH=131 /DNA_ID=CAMNT_0004089337 /DNA_START=273 /DNA_END=669 /DNA_ORIENTATION=+